MYLIGNENATWIYDSIFALNSSNSTEEIDLVHPLEQ
jgi:hypothetical protein